MQPRTAATESFKADCTSIRDIPSLTAEWTAQASVGSLKISDAADLALSDKIRTDAIRILVSKKTDYIKEL
jgi:hypothetical protein